MRKSLGKRGGRAIRGLYQKVESRILVSEGRKAVRRKARVAKSIAKKAVKAGVVAGVAAAVLSVARQVRKRREED